MFAMVLLSFFVLVALFRTRVKSVRTGETNVKYFQTYQGEPEADASLKLSRHFSNLFEAPLLFYTACITAMVVGAVDVVVHSLAWAYVALRVIHAFIHTGSNILQWRIAAYFSSWFVLVGFWLVITLHVAGQSG